MIHKTAIFKIYRIAWVFGILFSLGLLSPSANARDWQIQINAIDSHLAYLGGERYIFLEIFDENEKHIDHISKENIAFKINQKPYLFSDFYYQHQHLEQRVALLSGIEKALDSQELELIKKGFHQFIFQKNDSDEILIHFNGSGQESSVLKDKEDLEEIVKNATLDSDKSIPVADFLLKQIQPFRSSGKRQWMILLVPDSKAEIEETTREALFKLLINHPITLIPIIIGKPTSVHWLKTLVTQTQGRVYHIKRYEEFPALLQKLGEKIRQEYALTYRFNTLGNISHDIEIKFLSKKDLETIQHQTQSPSIWLYPQQPSPLVGIACIGGLVMALAGFALVRKWKSSTSLKKKGFQIMTRGENFQFIPLKEESYTLNFLSSIQTKGNLRLSANLSKVVLSAEKNSYFLEDKNYKNALLINRRRVRRLLLRHGDILDIGELTLIYLNPVQSPPLDEKRPEKNTIPMYFDKPQGPLRKKIGVLVEETTRQEYYLVKNITFIGRSKTNNIVLESPQIALRHAKIVQIGVQYKLHSLNTQEGSFVNRRRIEQRFLKDGDEISFDTCRLQFRIVHHPQLRIEKTRGESLHHA